MFVTIPADAVFHAFVSGGGCIDAVGLDEASDKPIEGEPSKMSFVRDFVRRTLLADRSFGTDLDAVTIAQEIRGYFDGKGPGDVVELPKGHLDKLLESARKPAGGYNGPIAGQMVRAGFFRALEKADEKDPRDAAGKADAK